MAHHQPLRQYRVYFNHYSIALTIKIAECKKKTRPHYRQIFKYLTHPARQIFPLKQINQTHQNQESCQADCSCKCSCFYIYKYSCCYHDKPSEPCHISVFFFFLYSLPYTKAAHRQYKVKYMCRKVRRIYDAV